MEPPKTNQKYLGKNIPQQRTHFLGTKLVRSNTPHFCQHQRINSACVCVCFVSEERRICTGSYHELSRLISSKHADARQLLLFSVIECLCHAGQRYTSSCGWLSASVDIFLVHKGLCFGFPAVAQWIWVCLSVPFLKRDTKKTDVFGKTSYPLLTSATYKVCPEKFQDLCHKRYLSNPNYKLRIFPSMWARQSISKATDNLQNLLCSMRKKRENV